MFTKIFSIFSKKSSNTLFHMEGKDLSWATVTLKSYVVNNKKTTYTLLAVVFIVAILLLVYSYKETKLIFAKDGDYFLVKDINTISFEKAISYQGGNKVFFSGVLYLNGSDDTKGQELWRSNGTESGTFLLKDIFSGSGSSNPTNFVFTSSAVYFVADNGVNGRELWKSDGTDAGTVMVKDINPGPSDSDIIRLTADGDMLFFAATNGSSGSELWKSDGTDAGTVMVKDINALGDSFPEILLSRSGTVYFTAVTDLHGRELWKSDGTDAGTVMVKDIATGTESSGISDVVYLNESLYFRAYDVVSGSELWKSDGTDAGTVMVKDIEVGINSSDVSNIVVSGELLYFSATTETYGTELWKSDGTDAGTVIVKDISAEGGSSIEVLGSYFGVVFFRARTESEGLELWKSDGTDAGTVMVKDINVGMDSSNITQLIQHGSFVYFGARDSEGGGFWKTDGTGVGTTKIHSFEGGETLVEVNGIPGQEKYVLSVEVPETGNFLWLSEGTTETTHVVDKNEVNTLGSSPSFGVKLGSYIYFGANDGEPVSGFELWRTDGTNDGTNLVKDINSGTNNSNPSMFTKVGDTIYFVATENSSGAELWKTDGTNAGTVMVKDIASGASDGEIDFLFEFNDKLIFTANDSINGTELWITDGTLGGTSLVKDISPFSGATLFEKFIKHDNLVYIKTTNSGFLRTDGTEAGTFRLDGTDLNFTDGGEWSMGNDIAALNGDIIFSAELQFPGHGLELYGYDTNSKEEYLIKDINVGTNSSYITSFVPTEGEIYFVADDGIHGYELWKTDGTATGTVMIKDIFPGSESSLFSLGKEKFVVTDGGLFFTAIDGVHGEEIWFTNGTEEGTVLLKDIEVGPNSSSPFRLVKVSGSVYFLVTNLLDGKVSLWKTNGTEVGTVKMPNFTEELDFSTVSFMAGFDNVLYFDANNGISGLELWKHEIVSTDPPLPPTNIVVSVSSSSSVLLSYEDNATGENFYVIEKSLDGLTYNIATTTGQNNQEVLVDGLTPDTGYWFRVAAINSFGTSTYTATQNVAYTLNVAPTGLSYQLNEERKVSLSWDGGATTTIGVPGAEIITVFGNSYMYNQVFSCGETYVFSLNTINTAGAMSSTSTISVVIPPCGGEGYSSSAGGGFIPLATVRNKDTVFKQDDIFKAQNTIPLTNITQKQLTPNVQSHTLDSSLKKGTKKNQNKKATTTKLSKKIEAPATIVINSSSTKQTHTEIAFAFNNEVKIGPYIHHLVKNISTSFTFLFRK